MNDAKNSAKIAVEHDPRVVAKIKSIARSFGAMEADLQWCKQQHFLVMPMAEAMAPQDHDAEFIARIRRETALFYGFGLLDEQVCYSVPANAAAFAKFLHETNSNCIIVAPSAQFLIWHTFDVWFLVGSKEIIETLAGSSIEVIYTRFMEENDICAPDASIPARFIRPYIEHNDRLVGQEGLRERHPDFAKAMADVRQ